MSANLEGSANDDGLVDPLSYFWEQISGPVAANIIDPTSLLTTVNFSKPGYYTLKLTVDDGAVKVSDETNVIVYPDNDPPLIITEDLQMVGAEKESNYSSTASILRCQDIDLSTSVTDDDLPMPLTYEWSIEDVRMKPISDTSVNVLTARFSAEPSDSIDWPLYIEAKNIYPYHNTYSRLAKEVEVDLILLVSDGYHSVQDTLTVNCNVAANEEPIVDAGDDIIMSSNYSSWYEYKCQDISLNGSVSDDGLPSPLHIQWSVVSVSEPYEYRGATTKTYATFSGQSPISSDWTFSLRTYCSGCTTPDHLPDEIFAELELIGYDGFHNISDTLRVTCTKD